MRVSPTQFPRIHTLYGEVCRTLDVAPEWPVYVQMDPTFNQMVADATHFGADTAEVA